MAVPQQGTNVVITVSGVAVIAVPAGATGGYIVNPYLNTDQDIATAETLYVDPVGTPGAAPGSANGTTVGLYPGQRFDIIPGSTLPVKANAFTAGHKFTVVYW